MHVCMSFAHSFVRSLCRPPSVAYIGAYMDLFFRPGEKNTFDDRAKKHFARNREFTIPRFLKSNTKYA